MIGHTIYHPRKGSALKSTGIVGHTIYYPEKGIALTSFILKEWFYLSILLITGSSTELALFHVGYRPSLHVGLLQLLYLTIN